MCSSCHNVALQIHVRLDSQALHKGIRPYIPSITSVNVLNIQIFTQEYYDKYGINESESKNKNVDIKFSAQNAFLE